MEITQEMWDGVLEQLKEHKKFAEDLALHVDKVIQAVGNNFEGVKAMHEMLNKIIKKPAERQGIIKPGDFH